MNLKTAMPIVVMFLSFVVLAALPVQADFCLNGPGSHNYDTDGDGFADCEDNCPLQSNDQTDTDSDGIGDACDCGITVPVNNGHDLRVAISGAPTDCAIAVPAGTYTLDGNIQRTAGISVLGAGAGSTIINRSSGLNVVFQTTSQSGNIFIGGVTLTGGWRGVEAQSSVSGTLTLSDVIVTGNFKGGGILILPGGQFPDDPGGAIVDLNNSIVQFNSNTESGGGIRIRGADGAESGRLTARHSTITLNSTEGSGGGVFVEGTIVFAGGGFADFIECTIADNHADEQGGGVATFLPATVTIKDSVIDGNTAVGDGGGIYNDGNGLSGGSVMSLGGTTVSGNFSASNGGGIYNGGSAFIPGNGIFGAVLTMANVTISGNSADLGGGGLYNANSSELGNFGGKLSCQNCTITDNLASVGGGVFAEAVNSGLAEFGNSVIAGNLAVSGPDCDGGLRSRGFNLIEDPDGCTLAGDTTGDVAGIDPQLGPLADNGGPTLTHRPGPPLINAANPLPPWDQGLPRCPLLDQRGFPRPEGSSCDIGSVEEECPFDGTDSDADGTPDNCDCAPLDPTVRPPATVEGLQVEKLSVFEARLGWLPPVGADGGYSITRGLLSELSVGHYGSCLADGWPNSEYDDPDALPSGSCFTYLIQGLSLDCGPGPLGYGSGGFERFNEDPLACP